MSPINKKTQLADQSQALFDYLDALLDESQENHKKIESRATRVVESSSTAVTMDEIERKIRALKNENIIGGRSRSLAEALDKLPPEAPAIVKPNVPLGPMTTLPEINEQPANTPTQQQANTSPKSTETVVQPYAEDKGDVPEWARSDFQCLLFKVADLTLAVPLVKLSGVIRWDESQVTELPGHSPAFLGLRRHLGKNVKIMDAAKVIFPANKLKNTIAPAKQRVKQILLLDGGTWGLACDEIGEVISLRPDGVRWRTKEGKRPWLAGTVLAHLCALLDTIALADTLGKD